MRFFDLWGMPDDADGDIESYDYLFLGDYVDRGSH
jgi:protein phosphatase